jgi:hypothetical protein
VAAGQCQTLDCKLAPGALMSCFRMSDEWGMLLFFCRQNEGGEVAGGHRKLPLTLGIGLGMELVLIGSTAVSRSLFAAEALAGMSGRHSL